MKRLDQYNRVAGYLNKIFDLLNIEYFDGKLVRPVLTIQSTPKAYGHFTTSEHTWHRELGLDSHEINIGAGTLARPIEEVTATLLHEMIHYWNFKNGIQDCSRGGTYHSKRFKDAAEAHGLVVERSEKYGWSHTAPSDKTLEFCIRNDLSDILLCRNELGSVALGPGASHGAGGAPTNAKSGSRKYICPCCGISVRATKCVRIGCLNCSQEMILANSLDACASSTC